MSSTEQQYQDQVKDMPKGNDGSQGGFASHAEQGAPIKDTQYVNDGISPVLIGALAIVALIGIVTITYLLTKKKFSTKQPSKR